METQFLFFFLSFSSFFLNLVIQVLLLNIFHVSPSHGFNLLFTDAKISGISSPSSGIGGTFQYYGSKATSVICCFSYICLFQRISPKSKIAFKKEISGTQFYCLIVFYRVFTVQKILEIPKYTHKSQGIFKCFIKSQIFFI